MSRQHIRGRDIEAGMILRFEYGDFGNWVNAHINSVEPRGIHNELIVHFNFTWDASSNHTVILKADDWYELVG